MGHCASIIIFSQRHKARNLVIRGHLIEFHSITYVDHNSDLINPISIRFKVTHWMYQVSNYQTLPKFVAALKLSSHTHPKWRQQHRQIYIHCDWLTSRPPSWKPHVHLHYSCVCVLFVMISKKQHKKNETEINKHLHYFCPTHTHTHTQGTMTLMMKPPHIPF